MTFALHRLQRCILPVNKQEDLRIDSEIRHEGAHPP